MLHEALRLIRLFHDVSQTELARRFGLSKSYLSEIETGKKQPTLTLLQQYSEEFKLPMSSIMFFSEALEKNSFSERTRLRISQKVIALLTLLQSVPVHRRRTEGHGSSFEPIRAISSHNTSEARQMSLYQHR
jgi:transcriptional regulator with XRE-family HTH domain